MFDVSWGQLVVLGAVGVAITGRRDLPAACRQVGTQVGRVVGLLQGARARADQFAAQNELKQLQNELRSGLRELDQVRTELAVAASTQGMMGRTLGATTPSANRTARVQNLKLATAASQIQSSNTIQNEDTHVPPALSTSNMQHATTDTFSIPASSLAGSASASIPLQPVLAEHAGKAVLEDEWEKQGIGFQTQAEQIQKSRTELSGNPSGSEILDALLKQSLTWDQYDRVVSEQDQQLQDRIQKIQQQRKENDQ